MPAARRSRASASIAAQSSWGERVAVGTSVLKTCRAGTEPADVILHRSLLQDEG